MFVHAKTVDFGGTWQSNDTKHAQNAIGPGQNQNCFRQYNKSIDGIAAFPVCRESRVR